MDISLVAAVVSAVVLLAVTYGIMGNFELWRLIAVFCRFLIFSGSSVGLMVVLLRRGNND